MTAAAPSTQPGWLASRSLTCRIPPPTSSRNPMHADSHTEYRTQEFQESLLFGEIQGRHFWIHVCELIQVDAVGPQMSTALVCKNKQESPFRKPTPGCFFQETHSCPSSAGTQADGTGSLNRPQAAQPGTWQPGTTHPRWKLWPLCYYRHDDCELRTLPKDMSPSGLRQPQRPLLCGHHAARGLQTSS